MASRFNSLSKIQTEILKKIILDQPIRPYGFTFGYLDGEMDISKYTEDEVHRALDDLVKNGFIDQRGNEDVYIFSRDQFLETKSYFKKSIIFKKIEKSTIECIRYIWKYFIVAIIIAALIAYITAMITTKINNDKKENPEQHIKSSIKKNYIVLTMALRLTAMASAYRHLMPVVMPQ